MQTFCNLALVFACVAQTSDGRRVQTVDKDAQDARQVAQQDIQKTASNLPWKAVAALLVSTAPADAFSVPGGRVIPRIAELSAGAGRHASPLDMMADRKYVIGGNWKSNPNSVSSVRELCDKFKDCNFDKKKVEVVICPTTVHGAVAKEALGECGIELGIQSISRTGPGAFTGEVTAAMAKEMGYTWALIGHSERRVLFGETIQDTNDKLVEAQDAGLKVMFCIGESLEERESGITDEINQEQLEGALPLVKDWDNFVIAYEPVWAIGTGRTATPEQAQETQASIRAFIKDKMGDEIAEKVRIQYGGSANPGNVEGLAAKEDIDGFLVGGASLKPDFADMIDHLNKVSPVPDNENKQIGEKAFPNLPSSVKPGVVTGKALVDLLDYAKEKSFAIPGVNIVGTHSINACMEAAQSYGGPIMVTFSMGGGQFIAGKAALNDDYKASIAGTIAGAKHVHEVAKLYGVPVILHTDHCQKKWLPWIDGLMAANEEHFAQHGYPLFSSHMLDLSEESLEENVAICKKYLERMAKVDVLLEMELGITGGEEDGVDNTDVDSSKLYTQPEEVWYAYEQLSQVPNGQFTIAAAFGNVHGVYSPGNVKLQPVILHNTQKFISEKLGDGEKKPVKFVFHGGSGSSPEDIAYAIEAGVIKMNMDTDTQWAFWDGMRKYEDDNRDYLQRQIGNPEGDEKPNKKYYDPRMPFRAGEESMANRLVQAAKDLGCVGVL